MGFVKKLVSILVILLSFTTASLMAATVDATYTENFDTKIHNASDFGISLPGINVALQVGTLEIKTVGNGSKPAMYSIRINRSGNFGNGEEYWLTSSTEINWQTRFGAQLIAKVKFGSTTIVKFLNWNSGLDPLMGESEFSPNQYPIIIEFFFGIRNITNAAQTQGATFQFEDGSGPNLGNFKIQYRKNLNTQNYKDIPFTKGSNPLPFFDIDYNAGASNFLNGDAPDHTVFISLSIEQSPSQASINLLDAIGNSKAMVGSARLTLSGFDSPSEQGVTLAFADGNGSTDTNFLLKHSEAPSYIAFTLYLGGTKVYRTVPIPWGNLAFGNSNVKDLEVGGISALDAESALSGTYSDTIWVTITPLDTNLTIQ